MAKRTRAPARRGRATQLRKTKGKSARKFTAAKLKPARLSRRQVYTPELLAYTRQRFEQTGDSLAEIGAEVGLHRDTVRKIAKRGRWVRFVRPPQGLPATMKLLAQTDALERHPELGAGDEGVSPAVSASAEIERATPPLADTAARLHRVVLDELAALETLRAQLKRAPRGFSGTVRTLSILTETLQKLQRLQPQPADPGPNDDDMPADIDEFRNELARRIETFVTERTGAGDGSQTVAPAGDGALR